MNICDLDNCEVATAVMPYLWDGTALINTSSVSNLPDTYFASVLKGNGASLQFMQAGDSTQVVIPFVDNAYWLDEEGSPYTVVVFNGNMEEQELFTDSDGNPTTCFTFNVSNQASFPSAGTVTLNP